MTQFQYVDFAQLWKGEQELLFDLAASVAAGGTFLELGLGQGGAATLLYRASKDKDVRVHSVDVSPSQQGLANLKGTGVGVIGLKSTEAAKKWAEEGGTPIDLLFIDADHSLDSVVGDFNGWAPFLRAGATVIFHDYDPIERGGLKHLGVKIGVDTIIRRGLIGEAEHAYKLVYGSVAKRESMQVSTRDCRDTLARLARHIVEVRDGDHRGRDLVVDDRFAYLLKGCMKIDPDAQPVGPQRALDAARTYLVSAHPDGLLPAMLRQHGVPDASVTVIDSLIACYILDHALTHHFDHLVAQTLDKRAFLYWAESIQAYYKAHGRSGFPDCLENVPPDDIPRLANVILGEQVRLTLLAQALQTFVNWTP